MSLPARQRAVWLLGPESVELREVPLLPPGAGEVVVRIAAALTCGTDLKVFRSGGHARMLTVPGGFGHELAGTIAAVGAGVERWREGDRVVVANSSPCGQCRRCLGGRENLCSDLLYLNGAFAEYLTVPPRFAATSLHAVPARLSWEVAALAEPLACVLHGIERTPLDPGSDVLVIGAGAIGLLFVAALHADGHRVAAVDPHPQRLALAAELGAAAARPVERGTADDAELRGLARDAGGFDAAFETSASERGWRSAWAALRTGGALNLFAGPPSGSIAPLDLHQLHYRELAVIGAYHHRPALFARALDAFGSGAVDGRRLLTAERPLAEVADALQSMARRETVKVVIRP